MKITDRQIVDIARQLRDEENSQLHVSPWNNRRRLPQWLVAVPAAAVIGFLFGVWTHKELQTAPDLLTRLDTVYVTVAEPPTHKDTALVLVKTSDDRQVGRQTKRPAKVRKEIQEEVGRPVSEDNIRYDLLVRN